MSSTATKASAKDLRDRPEAGGECYICYLKPVVTPDMKVYACCGTQYALRVPTKNFPPELCLGDIHEFSRMIREGDVKPFVGARHCVRCYYGNYNRTLAMLLSDVQHAEFV